MSQSSVSQHQPSNSTEGNPCADGSKNNSIDVVAEQRLEDASSSIITIDNKPNDATDSDGDDIAAVDDKTFDDIIGAIEVIVTDTTFQLRMNQFLAANAQHFEIDEDNEQPGDTENRHEHHDLYQKYLALGEELLEDELEKQMPDDTSLLGFYTTLEQMSEEEAAERVPVEIFNLLTTFLSFEAFREQMIDYKKASQARGLRRQSSGQLDEAASSSSLGTVGSGVVTSNRRQRQQNAAVTVEDLIQITTFR